MAHKMITFAIGKYHEDGCEPHSLHTLLDYIDLYTSPKCSCCGRTDNLKMGYAGGNEVWLCPDAAREQLSEKE